MSIHERVQYIRGFETTASCVFNVFFASVVKVKASPGALRADLFYSNDFLPM